MAGNGDPRPSGGADASCEPSRFARWMAGVWLLGLILVCVLGWRDSYRAASHVWRYPESEMCSGIPAFESLAAALPANSNVIFVGAEPTEVAQAEFFEFFRRFFCIQYSLAPVVVHFAYTPTLATHSLANTVTTFVVDTRRDRSEILRTVHALASSRGQLVSEEVVGAEFVVATTANR